MGDGGVARAEDGTELDREKGAAFVLDNSDVDIWGVARESQPTFKRNKRGNRAKKRTIKKNGPDEDVDIADEGDAMAEDGVELRKCSLVCRCSWMHRILAEPDSGCTKKSSSTSGNCRYLILFPQEIGGPPPWALTRHSELEGADEWVRERCQ